VFVYLEDYVGLEIGLLIFPNHSCAVPHNCGFGDLRIAAQATAVQANMLRVTPTASAVCSQKVKC